MADPIDSKGRRSRRNLPDRSKSTLASEHKIEVISGLLASKKSLLDRSLAPPVNRSAGKSRTSDDSAFPSGLPESDRPGPSGHVVATDPTRLDPPVFGAANPREHEVTGEVESRANGALGPPPPSWSPIQTTSTSVGSAVEPVSRGSSKSRAAVVPPPAEVRSSLSSPSTVGRERAIDQSDHPSRSDEGSARLGGQSIPIATVPSHPGRPLDPVADPKVVSRHDTEMGASFARRSDPNRSTGVVQPSADDEVGLAPRVAIVGRSQGGAALSDSLGSVGPVSGPDPIAGVSPASTTAGVRSDRATTGGPSPEFVRNPASSDLRAMSQAGPGQSAQVGSALRAGYGQSTVDPGPDGSASPQGGPAVDLSRTNELLQQLIDAVRKPRGGSLPLGGASIYPER